MIGKYAIGTLCITLNIVACTLVEQMEKECDLEDGDCWCEDNKAYQCLNRGSDNGVKEYLEDCSESGQVCVELNYEHGLHAADCVAEEQVCADGYSSVCNDKNPAIWGTCNDAGVVLPEGWKYCGIGIDTIVDCMIDTDTKSARCVPHDYDAGE